MNHRIQYATVFALGALVIITLLLAPGAITPSSRPSAMPILPKTITLLAIGILLLAFLVALGISIVNIVLHREPEDPDVIKRRRALIRLIVSVVASFFFFYLLMAIIISLFPTPDESDSQGFPSGESGAVEEEREDSREFPQFVRENDTPIDDTNQNRIVALVALIVGSVASIIVAIIGLRRLRNAPRAMTDEEAGLDDALLPAVHLALDRLLEGSDDREAVIAAYGMVETTFAEYGFRRDPAVTPRVFVERVVSTIWDRTEYAYKSLVDLSLLFELAKFSDHRVEQVDRNRAIVLMERLIVYLETRREDDDQA